jgi:diguanylate cyclase (GGDEF)-like protein
VSTFDDEDARLFRTLGNHAAMALEKGRLIEQLKVEATRRQHQALHDDLTGLPNRLHFHEACRQALAGRAPGELVAVMLMDLDLFKDVNDTLGHQTGDDLLVEVAQRIARSIRTPDLAARLGGDEFAVLLHDIGDEQAAVAVAERLVAAVHAPYEVHGFELEMGISVGAAIAPVHGEDPQTLLQHADVAMYAAKRDQVGVRVYSAEADQHSPWRLQLATELRRAIRDEELVVHFQPKARLADGEVIGVEALVRWPTSPVGPVRPDEFVPVAEQAGLITPLTMLVLRHSIAATLGWRHAGHDVPVAVNISTRSLLDPDFPDEVLGLLRATGFPAERLTLEITESSIMSDTRRALDVLERLAGTGIRLSVDDFGTGYSSLSYLQRLPVHELKVDRSFVFQVSDDQGSRAIIRSVVELGHSLGLQIVAEGVENQTAWSYLLEAGCDIGQGYFLSRPISEPDMLSWLHRHRHRAATAPAPPMPGRVPVPTPIPS